MAKRENKCSVTSLAKIKVRVSPSKYKKILKRCGR